TLFRSDREADGAPIDATGVLTDGTPLSGPVDLRNALLEQSEQFVQTLTEKLKTYAIGRSLTHKDMPTVRRIVRQSAAENYRFSSIVLAIAGSEQFRLRRLPETAGVVASVTADE